MKVCFIIFMLFFVSISMAQITHPKASPASVVEQYVGLSKITIKYARPAVRGRVVFGELVPYNRIWRVGANASTKITIDSDMTVLGNVLPKGTYAIYAFPQKDSWEIAFHKNTTHWGDGRKNYNAEEDVFRISVVPEKRQEFQENFLITFDKITHNSIQMLFVWENTKVSIPFKVHTDTLMQEEISRQLKENPTAQTYYESARYFQEQGKKYSLALMYLNKAISLGGENYYFFRVKSLVEVGLGDLKEAIVSAEKSLQMAKELGKDEFVRVNEKNINLWRKMLKTHKN